MCIAIAAYENRIAALFESSERLVIFYAPAYDMQQAQSIRVRNHSAAELIKLLKANHVTILICGAIRGGIQYQIEALNIKVIPWITGDLKSVVQAYVTNNLVSPAYLMPGCRNRGHQNRQRFRGDRQNY